MPNLEDVHAPQEVIDSLRHLQGDLAKAAGPNLAALLVYGGLARGRFTPGRSDINVVVVLRDASTATLAKISKALHGAYRTHRVDALLLTPDEVRKAADVFPTKFVDIQRHHIVLFGENPFATIEVSKNHLRLRVEQELRNLTLRLRRRFVLAGGAGISLDSVLSTVAAPLAVELASLLRLAGKEAPQDDALEPVFEAAARSFDLDRDALAALARLKNQTATPSDPAVLYGRILATVAKAAEAADALEVAG